MCVRFVSVECAPTSGRRSWLQAEKAEKAKADERQNVVIVRLSSCRLPSCTMCDDSALFFFFKAVIYRTEEGLFG